MASIALVELCSLFSVLKWWQALHCLNNILGSGKIVSMDDHVSWWSVSLFCVVWEERRLYCHAFSICKN